MVSRCEETHGPVECAGGAVVREDDVVGLVECGSRTLESGLFTILNCGLVFPESPNTTHDVRRSSVHMSIQTGQLTNDHIVAIGHLGHSNSHMSDLDQETIS